MNKLMYSAEEVNQILLEITLDKAKAEEKLQKIEQIVYGSDDFIKRNADYKIAEIREVLEKE